MRPLSIYEKAKALGIEIASHESDLYLPVTAQTQELVTEHRANGGSATVFTSNTDGKRWFDIPFHYDPFWESRTKR